ncbi:MAG: DNA gyrase subunit A [Gemmatimonas sp.]
MNTPPDTPTDSIPPALPPDSSPQVAIEDEMRRSYLDYAMSVIVARALPDARDGLKPVHRRILYAMHENGYHWNRPFRKSARIVGDVMGKYHPHGDAAIYDAMVRMAQDFSMRLPLIEGQGNFGSMDGDPAAAMRYTEARLAKVSDELLNDIDKETVDFNPNYDDTTREPSVLPAKFPNLLVNGANGIAVGMATNIPPHNLGEVIDAVLACLDAENISFEALVERLPGPDFPTGGIILGRSGIRAAYATGRGSVVVRARTKIEQVTKDRDAIVVTEVPYQVNKSRMLEQIAEMVRDKRIEGISELRDESDRDGVRVVIELKRDAMAEVVLNQLYRYSQLQTTFGINSLALNRGRPVMMDLRSMIHAFIEFRDEVITRRTVYELGKARERGHVLVGLAIAVANIDEVIALIRRAPNPEVAREQLMERAWPAGDVAPLVDLIAEPDRKVVDGTYKLSEVQARAILDLRLHRLTGLERDKIAEELREVCVQIAEYIAILNSKEKLRGILRAELEAIKAEFANPRRTEIQDIESDVDIEDLIAREDMVVTVSHAGYIKRVPLSTYRAQRRGGKGRSGMATREEDFVSRVFVANTHQPVLFFSSRGMAYKEKVYRLPVGTPQSRGKALVNLLPLAEGEVITTVMPLPEDESTHANLFVMFATSTGDVRRNRLSDFTDVRANGKIAMKLGEGERLVAVLPCTDKDDILLASRDGKCIRFEVADIRVFASRNSTGNRGIKLDDGDEVISMSILRHTDATSEERAAYLRHASALRRRTGEEVAAPSAEDTAAGEGVALSEERLATLGGAEQFILTIADSGYGKRSSSYEYRITNRGGKGIDLMDLGKVANAKVIAAFPVEDGDQIMLVTNNGKLIRSPVNDIRIAGRTTRGVTLFKMDEGERVVSVAHLAEVSESPEVSVGVENAEASEVTPPIPDIDPNGDSGDESPNA